MVTQDELKERLTYDPETGVFTWKKARKGNTGRTAGTHDRDGYIVIHLYQRQYRAHRLAWLYVYGEWPRNQIDHINGIRDDNRILNLRDVTPRENSQNQKFHRDGKPAGVTRTANGNWMGSVQVGKRSYCLGTYPSIEEARKMYEESLLHLDDLPWFDKFKIKGCYLHKKSNKWRAAIKLKGVHRFLGAYLTEHEAHAAYLKAKEEYELEQKRVI